MLHITHNPTSDLRSVGRGSSRESGHSTPIDLHVGRSPTIMGIQIQEEE